MLSSSVSSVRGLLSQVERQLTLCQWLQWLCVSHPHAALTLDRMLADSNMDGWVRQTEERRRHKQMSHARAFTQLLTPSSSDPTLSALLVDGEYSSESELFVDRLWTLATNTNQQPSYVEEGKENESERKSANAMMDVDGGVGVDGADAASTQWTYPPPSCTALLNLFALSDAQHHPAQQIVDGRLISTPISYKVWLVYYMLIDGEWRMENAAADSHAVDGTSRLSSAFAQHAGLDEQQQALIAAMVHMDAAYTPHKYRQDGSGSLLPPVAHSSFVRALAFFSTSYSSLLTQPHFPFVSSILASILALRQWSSGSTFMQNLLLANDAAETRVRTRMMQLKSRAERGMQIEKDDQSIEPFNTVLYTSMHHVLHLHILLEQGLVDASIRFIRSLPCEAPHLPSALQLLLWRYLNHHLLSARNYAALIKQTTLANVEEKIVIGYWRKLVASDRNANGEADGGMQSTHGSSNVRTLSPADVIILYYIEHHAISRALRFYHHLQRSQQHLPIGARARVTIPATLLAAYSKAVPIGDDAEGEDEEDRLQYLDPSAIHLNFLQSQLDRDADCHARLVKQILHVHADTIREQSESVSMMDVQRAGSELNPFVPINERQRMQLEAAEAAAASKKVIAEIAAATRPASAIPSSTSPPSVASFSSPPPAIPRVQRLPATHSAAKAKAKARQEELERQMQQEQEKEKDKEEEQEKEKAQPRRGLRSASAMEDEVMIGGDEEKDEDEDAAQSFPSFAAVSSQFVPSSALTTPPRSPQRTAATPSPARPKRAVATPSSASKTRPLAFSEVANATSSSAATPAAAVSSSAAAESESVSAAAFMLPLPTAEQPQAAATAYKAQAPAEQEATPAPKRSTRLRRTRSTESESSTAPPSPSLPATTSSSSAATPSIATTRARTSRKRPLLKEAIASSSAVVSSAAPLPTLPPRVSIQPNVDAATVNGTAAAQTSDVESQDEKAERKSRATRATRTRTSRRRGKAVDGAYVYESDASSSHADEEMSESQSVASSRSSLGSRTRRAAATTRRRKNDDDSVMEDASAMHQQGDTSRATRSSRRTRTSAAAATAAPTPVTPAPTMARTRAARRTRTKPIYVDESVLSAGESEDEASTVQQDSADDGDADASAYADGHHDDGELTTPQRDASPIGSISVGVSGSRSPARGRRSRRSIRDGAYTPPHRVIVPESTPRRMTRAAAAAAVAATEQPDNTTTPTQTETSTRRATASRSRRTKAK